MNSPLKPVDHPSSSGGSSAQPDCLTVRMNAHMFELHSPGSYARGDSAEQIVAHRKQAVGMQFIVEWKRREGVRPLASMCSFQQLKANDPGLLLQYIGHHVL